MMPVLLYLVILVAVAVGAYFFYKQRGCILAVCSKKTDTPEPTAPRTAQPPTETSSVRKRIVAPAEADVATAKTATVVKTAVSSSTNSKASDYLDPNVPPPQPAADAKPIDAVSGGVDPLASVNEREEAAAGPVPSVSDTRTAIASTSAENTAPSTATSNSNTATATTSGTNVDKKKKKKSKNKKNKSKKGKTKSKGSKNSKPKQEVKLEA